MEKEDLVALSDSHMDKDEWKELYALLTDAEKNKFMDDPDICWRMAWSCHEYSNLFPEDKEMRKKLTFDGYNHARRGYEKDKNHGYCNLWMGIFLDLTAEYEGIKKRLEMSARVKEHFEKSLEQNPNCPLSLHSLGVWYFEFADISWVEKKLLSFLSNPPKCTYEDALKYFEAAERAEPYFYSCNLLYLGKCYSKLGDKRKAKDFLEKCIAYKGSSVEDEEARAEARDLLKKL